MKAAIIGCGLIGSKRATALPKDVSLVACFDLHPTVAIKFAAEFGCNPANSIDEILELEGLDFVVIATRHDALAPIALRFIKAKINIFIEKPGALNSIELNEVIAQIRLNGLKGHIGFNHQFHPAILEALRIRNSNRFGKVMFLRARYGHGGRLGYEKEWRADKTKSGGGELIDQGTHLLDLSTAFLGQLELDYAATPTYFWDMAVEDNAFISVRNREGNIGFLQASCTEWKNMFSLEIYFERGKLEVFGLGRSYGLETLTIHEMLPEMGPPSTEILSFPEPDDSWAKELDLFVKDIRNDTDLSDNLESSLQVMKLIDEIYSRTGR